MARSKPESSSEARAHAPEPRANRDPLAPALKKWFLDPFNRIEMPLDIVVERASRQHGVLTRRDLLDAGVPSSTLGRWVKRGLIRRMQWGVYLIGVKETREAWWMAAVLAAGPEAVLSHVSAARCWELIRGARWRVSHVTVPAHRSGRIRGIRIVRSRYLTPDDCSVCRDIPITSPARTLVDLAEHLGATDLERALARADRKELATRDEVSQALERCGTKRGTRTLRVVLGRDGDPALTRSEAEARFLELVRRAGLREPRTNMAMGPWEVDFYWPGSRIAVEVDGFEFHSSRTSFENDRRKDGWLARKNISVLRFTWRQLQTRPLETVATLTTALRARGG